MRVPVCVVVLCDPGWQGPGEDDIARHSAQHECVDEYFPPAPQSISQSSNTAAAVEWHHPRGALYVHSERCGDVVVGKGVEQQKFNFLILVVIFVVFACCTQQQTESHTVIAAL
jgi:hypothetical protein